MDLEVNSFYIAGYDKENIFFGNSTGPFHLLMTNALLTDSQHVMLKIIDLDSVIQPRRFRLSVDSPYFFLSHGTLPIILKGNISSWEAKPVDKGNTGYFVESVPISSSSFAFRSYNLQTKGNELAKQAFNAPFEFKSDLLQKQMDGVFCVDGKSHYNKSLNIFIYLYYYRNEFILADSNLNLINRMHTIDTFSHVMVKVAQIETKNKNVNESMLSSPPTRTNGRSCTYGQYLFIQSPLLAKNESTQDFIEGSIIDVYNLKTGGYVSSFYLPNYKNQQPTDFQVMENHLVAIYSQFLVLYEIDQKKIWK